MVLWSWEEGYLICLSFRGLSLGKTVVMLYFPLVFFLFHLKKYLCGDFPKEFKGLWKIVLFFFFPSPPKHYLAGMPVLWRESLSVFGFFHEPWGFVVRDSDPGGNSTLTEESSYSCNAHKIFCVGTSLGWNSVIIKKISAFMWFSWPVTKVGKAV